MQQVVDMQPGIAPNGLFWTGQVPKVSLKFDRKSNWARFKVKDYPLVESYVIFGRNTVHASVDIDIRWRANGPSEHRGSGASVAPDDPAAFEGEFRTARATGRVDGSRPGLDFTATNLDSSAYYGSIGPMRNGVYLT